LARESISPPSSLHGRFITFEGIDGCGKTTQARLLAERLKGMNYPVLTTREPGGTEIGQSIRKILLDIQHTGMAPECELLLFLGDRVQHLVEVIRPKMKQGDVVICDRYHDATVAYQQYGRNLDLDAFRPLITNHIRPEPDLTFWIDITVEQSLERTLPRHGELVEGIRKPIEEQGDAPSRASQSVRQVNLDLQLAMPLENPEASQSRLDLEYRAFHERVRDGYRSIADANPKRVVRIDGTPPTEAVHEAIWSVLSQRFAL